MAVVKVRKVKLREHIIRSRELEAVAPEAATWLPGLVKLTYKSSQVLSLTPAWCDL